MRYDLVQISPEHIDSILTCIELDLRDLVLLHILPETQSAIETLGEAVYLKCCERFIKEEGPQSPNFLENLELLLPYTDFGNLIQIFNSHNKLLPKMIARHLRDNTARLERLLPIRNRVAHKRALYYTDVMTTQETSLYLIDNISVNWKNLKHQFEKIHQKQLGSSEDILNNLPVPEYLETGYIGRKRAVSDLIQAIINRPFPVTIIGDGGIGKSAIAQKVAYDIMSMSNCPFDAIIWSSAKNHQLTANEIIRVKDAIEDSLGTFRHIANFISINSGLQPIDVILEFLNEFKILLILDNLETILDEQMREFIRNIPLTSKVLITSRIGLGAYESPFKLLPLDLDESVQLLRQLATTRQLPQLSKLSSHQLESYCTKMKNNPLFIKWFVSAVQAGQRPEKVLETVEKVSQGIDCWYA